MKQTWFGLVLAAGMAAACGNNQTSDVRQAETTVAEAPPPQQASAARSLVARMISETATQSELGRMAATHAASKDVREFGKMVAEDHAQMSRDLHAIAAQFGSLPMYADDTKRALIDRLSQLEGAAFDREYIEAVAARYPDAMQAVQARGESRADKTGGGGPADRPEPVGTTGAANETQVVEEWAAKAAPTLQAHFERAEDIKKRLAGEPGKASAK